MDLDKLRAGNQKLYGPRIMNHMGNRYSSFFPLSGTTTFSTFLTFSSFDFRLLVSPTRLLFAR